MAASAAVAVAVICEICYGPSAVIMLGLVYSQTSAVMMCQRCADTTFAKLKSMDKSGVVILPAHSEVGQRWYREAKDLQLRRAE